MRVDITICIRRCTYVHVRTYMYVESRVHNLFYYELLVRIFHKEVMSMPLAELQKAQPDMSKAR